MASTYIRLPVAIVDVDNFPVSVEVSNDVGNPVLVSATNLDIRDLNAAFDSVAATQSGTWNINNISGTVSLPTGAATEATLSTRATETTASAISTKLTDNTQKTQIVNSSGSSVAVQTLGTTPTASDFGLLTNSLLYGLTTAGGGGYAPVKVNPSGTVTTTAAQDGVWTVTANAGTNLNTSALALESTLGTRLSESDFDTKTGALTETAPATDTASSGLNGRLQRIAQRITSLITLLPTSLGQKTMANSLAVVVASDQSNVPVSQATASALNAQVVGNAGSLASDSGNPVKVAGVFNTTLPTATNGQRVDAQANQFGEHAIVSRNKYAYITATGATTVKSGAGRLHTMITTPQGNATIVITIYDNTAASGTIIALIRSEGTSNTTSSQQYIFDAEFSTGLTINLSVAGNVTCTYQ